MEQRVVVTGMGLITSVGQTLEENWKNLLAGQSGVRLIDKFSADKLDTKFAAIASDDFKQKITEKVSKREQKQMTRTTKMAIAAATEAIADSGIDAEQVDPYRVAVILGVVSTSFNEYERSKSGRHRIVRAMPNAPSAWVSMKYGFKGPSFNVSTACASSAYAISLGKNLIANNIVDVAIVGGVDSHIDEEHIAGFNQILAMSTNNDEYQTASRPFSKTRDGFVMGEGAGILVLESETLAKKRNQRVYGEVLGSAVTTEAHDITAPKDDGEEMSQTMRHALVNAGVKPECVQYINAHGTSTNLNDKYETMAIKACFGEHAHQLNISSTKSMIGHTIGAAGAIEGIVTLKSIETAQITPTINYMEADPELDLNYTPNQAVDRTVQYAVSNSFGFGGHNASIVYGKYNTEA